MNKLSKLLIIVFLFGLSVGFTLNNNSNSEFDSNENSTTLVNSLRGGGKSDNNQNPAFIQTPPGQRSSEEELTNSQDLSKIPPRFGYRTAISGGKKLPDNPGGGSGDDYDQDNEDEFAWKNIQKDPEVWSNYQQYCQD